MRGDTSSYGLWALVAINSVFFALFAASFFKRGSARDWESLAIIPAFNVAFFTEMHGFPLTMYLLSGWLSRRFPGVDWSTYDAGHTPMMPFGGWPYLGWGPIHLVSSALILGGFWLLATAWPILYRAKVAGRLATTGSYAWLRHPQYAAFVLIITGFLLQWPTPLTVAMYPVMLIVYVQLARRDEAAMILQFRREGREYIERTSAWFPAISLRRAHS